MVWWIRLNILPFTFTCRTVRRYFKFLNEINIVCVLFLQTYKPFHCHHENLFVPTHTATTLKRLPICLFGRKPNSNLRIFKPSDFQKNKNTKGLYVTSRISTHDLLEDRNNHWQGLQCNLCFLLKFRQPCLLSAKIWTTSCVIIYKIVQKCANFIFATLSGTYKLVINFFVKNMRKDIKKISLEIKGIEMG